MTGANSSGQPIPSPGRAPAGRHLHLRLVHHRRRRRPLRRASLAALLLVVGPGLLAGLSDDDPAGITTYSILGAKYGYELLWVLALSTAALIVFHELGVRLGVVTGKGLLTLVRERYGPRAAAARARARWSSPTPARSAPSSPASPRGWSCSAATSRYVSVPLAAVGVSLLVLRGIFHRVEHVLLALSSVFVAYVVSGVLAHPDWGAAAHGPGRAEHAR